MEVIIILLLIIFFFIILNSNNALKENLTRLESKVGRLLGETSELKEEIKKTFQSWFRK